MLVYASQSSPRLVYILNFFSEELFDKHIQITTDQQEFLHYQGSRINYSPARISQNECWMYNVDLLFENNIEAQVVSCFNFNGNKAFFQTKAGDFSFDIFAAAFYLLSRYEEYLPHATDKYGRYAHVNSITYKESFLHLPLVNIWLNDFKKALLQIYPYLQFKKQSFTFKPTYDIDIAWSYSNKGWWRNTGGLLRSVIKLDRYALTERMKVLFRMKKDPYDSYEWLHTIHRLGNLKAIYFFLVAFKQKGYDKNISPLKKDLQALIKEHDILYTTGIHPSWQSGDDDRLLEQEIKRLERLVGHDIIHSRQHYLRFTLPATYQKLLSFGIKNDYSMGYGTVNGFRASVASSYYWFDLEKGIATDLLIHPFCFMDATAYYELKLLPAHALEQLVNFYSIIKEVNGQMITLWHNNFLGTDRSFAGWREIYECLLRDTIGGER